MEHLQFIEGAWRAGRSEASTDVVDPATEEVVGVVPHATRADLEAALSAAAKGLALWRNTPPFDRARVIRGAGALLRERVEAVALCVTREQGKPLTEARAEALASADILDWFAEEGRRAHGRMVAGRQASQSLQVRIEPVGPVAAFTPWNFPISQAARKVAVALAAGCSIVLKPSEEAPSGAAALVQALTDAGLPPGVLNLVMGDPSDVSVHLIASPVIRKISFTGSVPVGKQLAQLAAAQMKPCTMELGGHAPVIVCEDVDAAQAARDLIALKFRNAGQACIAPTRFFIHYSQYERFRDSFVGAVQALKVGRGLDPDSDIGPLANARRVRAIESLVEDARSAGAHILCGGERCAQRGFFFAPTVIENAAPRSRLMSEEPFGPIATLAPYRTVDDALRQSNTLPFGLAAYVFTDCARRADRIADALEVGLVSVNRAPVALPETPFGGVKESGYGREGGNEGLLPYMITKLVAIQH